MDSVQLAEPLEETVLWNAYEKALFPPAGRPNLAYLLAGRF